MKADSETYISWVVELNTNAHNRVCFLIFDFFCIVLIIRFSCRIKKKCKVYKKNMSMYLNEKQKHITKL